MIGPFSRAGAVGAITTVANLVPGEVRALLASIRRDGPDADQRERALAPLIDMVRLVPGAPTIKTALAAMEAIGPELRPPLAQLSTADRAKVVGALETDALRAVPARLNERVARLGPRLRRSSRLRPGRSGCEVGALLDPARTARARGPRGPRLTRERTAQRARFGPDEREDPGTAAWGRAGVAG